MIVMKFGGTSVADAECILRVAGIVRARLDRKPVVVVSALGGVTDLLVRAVELSLNDDLETLDPILGDVERRHRWAVAGAVDSASERHELSLELDRRFEELRRRLRSIRILREGTPRAVDAVLATGEDLSSRIVAAAFVGAGLDARAVDAREAIATDATHGAARVDLAATERLAADALGPLLDAGRVPVLGGFVGATPGGETTTLGRGGSDTSAACLGMVLGAEEIQIWTDVDGMMTADPRLVPDAARLERISFSEAADLAFYGAKVLHPASIAPAVQRSIPVRVLNALRPESRGTLVLGDRPDASGEPLASIATLRDVSLLRIAARRPTADPGFSAAVLEIARADGREPLFAHFERGAARLGFRGDPRAERFAAALATAGHPVDCAVDDGRALVCLVGAGLAAGPARGAALAALAALNPDALSVGASGSCVLAAIDGAALASTVEALHRRFFAARESQA